MMYERCRRRVCIGEVVGSRSRMLTCRASWQFCSLIYGRSRFRTDFTAWMHSFSAWRGPGVTVMNGTAVPPVGLARLLYRRSRCLVWPSSSIHERCLVNLVYLHCAVRYVSASLYFSGKGTMTRPLFQAY